MGWRKEKARAANPTGRGATLLSNGTRPSSYIVSRSNDWVSSHTLIHLAQMIGFPTHLAHTPHQSHPKTLLKALIRHWSLSIYVNQSTNNPQLSQLVHSKFLSTQHYVCLFGNSAQLCCVYPHPPVILANLTSSVSLGTPPVTCFEGLLAPQFCKTHLIFPQ